MLLLRRKEGHRGPDEIQIQRSTIQFQLAWIPILGLEIERLERIPGQNQSRRKSQSERKSGLRTERRRRFGETQGERRRAACSQSDGAPARLRGGTRRRDRGHSLQ